MPGPTAPDAPRFTYGDRDLVGFLPPRISKEGRLLRLRIPAPVPPLPDVPAALVRSVEESSTPEASASLASWLGKGYRGGDVAVIVDDYTRPCVHQTLLLPLLLDWLLAHGVARERILIVIATATHRDPRPAEYPHMFGDTVWPAWRDSIIPHHDYEDLERLGTMPDGTPVELNGRVARSAVVISLSDLDYHYFAGVTGGPKHLVPGVAGRALTTADHLQMFADVGFASNVDMGVLDGNPVYEYKLKAVRIIMEALRARGALAYGILSVLDSRHRIVALEGGEIVGLHRRLRHLLDRVYVAEVPRLADVAIVSARHLGLNVYQAGKAINAAARAVRPGGKVVCVAPCADGFGNEEFRGLMKVAAPILQDAEKNIAKGGDPSKEGASAIERALRAVQSVVMADFKIGRQKPVDLLVQYRHVGWGNLWLLCEGLTDEERALLPFRYVGQRGEDPEKRLRAWVLAQEKQGRPTYVVVDDPTYLIRVTAS